MLVRKSTTVWQGTLKEWKGRMPLGSGAFAGVEISLQTTLVSRG